MIDEVVPRGHGSENDGSGLPLGTEAVDDGGPRGRHPHPPEGGAPGVDRERPSDDARDLYRPPEGLPARRRVRKASRARRSVRSGPHPEAPEVEGEPRPERAPEEVRKAAFARMRDQLSGGAAA